MSISAKPLPGIPVGLPPKPTSGLSIWTWASLAIALATSAGSVWLSIGMKLKACPLCFYQRSFVLGIAVVLIMGIITRAYRGVALGLLVAPMAFGGLLVAGMHVTLEMTGKLECPEGVLGMGSAPLQSLIAFVLLSGLVATEATGGWTVWKSLVPLVVAGVLGLAIGQACLMSAPPLPPAPTKAYDSPPDICRPPFKAPA